MAMIDEATPLTSHPAVPTERLVPWLATTLGVAVDEISIGRFGRGFSNLTFLVTVGERELVLRRGPPGVAIARAHDMLREARIVQGIGRVWHKVPEVVALCDDAGVIGGPFYVMERLRGVILRDRAPKGLELTPGLMGALSRNLVSTLAEIHQLDVVAAGLGEVGRPEGYIARQVAGWTKRYGKAKTDEVPDVDAVATWLAEHMPQPTGATLIHNDLKYDNVILDVRDVTEVRAVLDWEMATVGEPRMDLGTFLAYWIQADDPPELQVFRFSVTDAPGNLTREQIVAAYVEDRGGESFDPLWYFVFGLFKNCVIGQQLYARYVAGLTTEARYAGLIWAVRGMAAVAMRAIARERIEGLVA